MKLPPQSPPVNRDLKAGAARLAEGGVVPAQNPCEALQGMARQMCFAINYGIST